MYLVIILILYVLIFFFYFVFCYYFFFFFFFSSRRRHTRYLRDWSSDVCSSDLSADAAQLEAELRLNGAATVTVEGQQVEVLADEVIISERPREGWSVVNEQGETVALEIGRASCRERV